MWVTHRVFFLPCKLARSLEIDAKVCELAFIVFADVLDGIDMEGYSKPVYREYDGLCLPVHKDLHRYEHVNQYPRSR